MVNDKIPDKVDDDGETLTKKPKKKVHPRKKNRREERQAEGMNLAPIADAPEELQVLSSSTSRS